MNNQQPIAYGRAPRAHAQTFADALVYIWYFAPLDIHEVICDTQVMLEIVVW